MRTWELDWDGGIPASGLILFEVGQALRGQEVPGSAGYEARVHCICVF
jgi:hypothetical protein